MNFPSSRPPGQAARRSVATLLVAGLSSTLVAAAASAGPVRSQTVTTVRRAGPAAPKKVTVTTKATVTTVRTSNTRALTATTKRSTATTKRATATTKRATATTKRSTATTKRATATTSAPTSGGVIEGDVELDSLEVSTSTTAATVVPGATTTTAPVVVQSGPTPARTPTVFIPGAGRVLDLNATEVAKLATGGRVEADVRGASGLAASGTGWVIVDVTAATPTRAGKVTLSPSVVDPARPGSTSAVPFAAGPSARVRAAVAVGANGSVRVDTTAGLSGLAVDVVGWVVPLPATATNEAAATKLEACTMLDTGTGLGGLAGAVTPDKPFDLPAVGVYGVPGPTAANAPTSVLFQLTVTQASEPLSITVVPTGRELPSLVLHAAPGQSATGVFAVPVAPPDTRSAFYVSAGGAVLAVDMLGWLDKDSVGHDATPCS